MHTPYSSIANKLQDRESREESAHESSIQVYLRYLMCPSMYQDTPSKWAVSWSSFSSDIVMICTNTIYTGLDSKTSATFILRALRCPSIFTPDKLFHPPLPQYAFASQIKARTNSPTWLKITIFWIVSSSLQHRGFMINYELVSLF